MMLLSSLQGRVQRFVPGVQSMGALLQCMLECNKLGLHALVHRRTAWVTSWLRRCSTCGSLVQFQRRCIHESEPRCSTVLHSVVHARAWTPCIVRLCWP